ncbi:MAG: bifunctional UDP-sugar hydrolase/5'-nucleotidase [Eubacteriales bacterium]|nr:bifunctional UDP-sugar hydrolase/5'-nucleotidase [Eubacteriales bacterium]
MKQRRRLLALLLSIVMVFSFTIAVFAEEKDSDPGVSEESSALVDVGGEGSLGDDEPVLDSDPEPDPDPEGDAGARTVMSVFQTTDPGEGESEIDSDGSGEEAEAGAENIQLLEAETKTLTFVHFNDYHANVMENEDSGQLGLAKFKTYVDQENPDLILDAGDTLHGTTFATVSEGATMRTIMSEVGIDVATGGNHDFNYGTDRLIELSKDGKYPILIANYQKSDTNTKPFMENMIFTKQGLKIGIFGLTTPETKTASNPLNTAGYEFLDPVATAKQQVEYLKSQDVDVIVALAHLGLYASEPLAKAVEGIDIIIDGHSHDALPNGLLVAETDTLIATAGYHLQNIGRIEIELDGMGVVTKKTATLIPYSEASKLDADAAIAASIEELNKENEEMLSVVLGETLVELDGERENVRTRETNLGSLIADVMLEETGADVALTNGGGIRASIPKGEITMGHVLTTFPFTNFLRVIEVSGSDILAALEHGLSADLDEEGNLEQNGGFPQIAGMRVVFDKTREAGKRVVTLTIDGEDVNPEANYTLVTNDFLAVGGDGYTMFEGATILSELGLLSEVLASYIQENETINPATDGRITELSNVKVPDTDLPATGESRQLVAVGFIFLIVGGTLVFIPIKRYQLRCKEE